MRLRTELMLSKTTRVCRDCGIEKSLSEYSPDYRVHHQYQTQCKSCKREWARKDRKLRPDVYKHRDLNMYGIGLDDYKKMLSEQNGVCAICHRPELKKRGYLHVDHCHRTNKVRGLLCGNCNTAIGKFYESIHYMKSAIEYLEKN